jgi:hypothetical protein
MQRDPQKDWATVQANDTYWQGALDNAEGLEIKWHSPAEPQSSQVFCISAFGGLRRLPDGQQILSALLSNSLPGIPCQGPWAQPIFEHTERDLLGETGPVMPTSIDAFYTSPKAVICVESKFLFDAREGFGGCSQIKKQKKQDTPNCAGYYGPGSDLKTASAANCRLEIQDGTRGPRRYWSLGRKYFVDSVFQAQSKGQTCSFAGASFQLMRNVLFAAETAGEDKSFGVLAIAPEKINQTVSAQIAEFRSSILRSEYRNHIALATYEQLITLLSRSTSDEGRKLGIFLEVQINKWVQ